MTALNAAVSEKGLSVRMTANLRRDRSVLHSTRRSSAVFRLSQRWGCSEKTVECRLYGERGLFQQAADVVEIMTDSGESERLAGLTACYEAAMVRALPDWPTLLAEYGKADANEDLREADFRRELPTDLTDDQLVTYKRAVAHEALWANRMLAKIEEEEQRRREAKQ